MREERLLERIRSRAKEPDRRARQDVIRKLDSVIRHLQQILNTHRGNVPIATDYGLPDYNDFLHAYPDSVRDMERSIRDTIHKYEPRLKTVRVSYLPEEEDDFAVRFRIAATLAGEQEEGKVVLESILGAGGEVKIRR